MVRTLCLRSLCFETSVFPVNHIMAELSRIRSA